MTIDNSIHKLDFSIGAYQNLIDENVANGEVVGKGVRGTWTASTPLNKAYSDMIEALQTAKDTMRKYQKIEQIANDKNINGDLLRMSEIRWVLENSEYDIDKMLDRVDELPSVTPQEPKIKVLERDEAMRKLGAVDIYQARAWITLLDDLEYLKLKICEVDNGNND